MSDCHQLRNKVTSSVLDPLHGTRIPIMLERNIVSFPMDSNLLTIVDISPCGYFVVMVTSVLLFICPAIISLTFQEQTESMKPQLMK